MSTRNKRARMDTSKAADANARLPPVRPAVNVRTARQEPQHSAPPAASPDSPVPTVERLPQPPGKLQPAAAAALPTSSPVHLPPEQLAKQSPSGAIPQQNSRVDQRLMPSTAHKAVVLPPQHDLLQTIVQQQPRQYLQQQQNNLSRKLALHPSTVSMAKSAAKASGTTLAREQKAVDCTARPTAEEPYIKRQKLGSTAAVVVAPTTSIMSSHQQGTAAPAALPPFQRQHNAQGSANINTGSLWGLCEVVMGSMAQRLQRSPQAAPHFEHNAGNTASSGAAASLRHSRPAQAHAGHEHRPQLGGESSAGASASSRHSMPATGQTARAH